MPKLLDYFVNAGPGQPGRNAKGTDPRTVLQASVKPKILAWATGSSNRKDFQIAPFNWEMIDKAIATDTYVNMAMMKYDELIWKEGYDLKGALPDSMAYIDQRFKVLGLAQGQSFNKFLQEVTFNLVRYHNCFIVKVRDPNVAKIAGLSVKGLDGKEPIAGYFIIPTKTVSIQSDEFGKVLAYQQSVGANQKPIQFKPEDVIHVRHNRPTGTHWGVPFLDSALEDIRSFRLIEEDMLNIVHTEIYPLLWWSVNGAKPDWPVDMYDIQDAYAELENMKNNGALVTKGSDKLEIMGGGGKALDVQPYIDHFKERAVVGLGMSPYHIGITDNISLAAASRLDAALYDKIKTYQRTLVDAINNELIFELMIEGGFDPLSAQKLGKQDPTVYFEFREIDVDAQIKRNNHVSVMWLQNMITHDQMRTMIGMVPDPTKIGLYHLDMVELPITEASKAITGPEGGANPNSPAKGTAGSTNNPANKSGNRGGPKISRNAAAEMSYHESELLAREAIKEVPDEEVTETISFIVNDLFGSESFMGTASDTLSKRKDLVTLLRHAVESSIEPLLREAMVIAAYRTLKQEIIGSL